MKNLHQIREISIISFNERVLQEAEDCRNPLLERLKFLGIFSSNMDEFFKVRVASMHRRIELGDRAIEEVLEVVSKKARELDERFRRAYKSIVLELQNQGIRILDEQQAAEQPELAEWLTRYFRSKVLHRLVPIIVEESRPFPQLVDGSLYVGVVMRGTPKRYAILEIPSDLPRFIELPTSDIMYLDDLIRYSLHEIFYVFNYERIEAYEFKISRDAELDVDNDFAEDYVEMMERELRQRHQGRPTRLVYDAAITPGLLSLLRRELRISDYDTLIAGGRYHNMKDLMNFPVHRADLSFERQEPHPHPVLEFDSSPILDVICQRDILITYPYQSFTHVLRALREAAIHPEVTAIKMTLYRAARNSQIVNALINGARNGKKIFVSIELQARFDEENNIDISERLKAAGAEVVFGVPPMKVHAKLLLIQYGRTAVAGLSTGNFNENTGRLYVDSMLFTVDKRLTDEVEDVFTLLDRASRLRIFPMPTFKYLLVSPFNTRQTMMKLIRREQQKGSEGYIYIKANHLTDTRITRAIRDAADAGVKMDHIIRTTYAMRPHPNIRAISILDRYLEHQRMYAFGRGKDCALYMSSADLMERNLDWRVEAAFPILDPDLKEEMLRTIEFQVGDTMKARVLDETQSNRYVDESGTRRAQYDTYHFYGELFSAAAARHAALEGETQLRRAHGE